MYRTVYHRIVDTLIRLVFFSLVVAVAPASASANLGYKDGYYTNLCGTGFAATADTCNAGCNTSTGKCSTSGSYVVKFTCDGKTNECRSNESSFSPYKYLTPVGCNKTVQIDVFNKKCRVDGNWVCGDNDLQDYMVWYSGECPIPTATPTVKPTSTPRPTTTPRPTSTPRPTATPKVTATPKPTKTPTPTPRPQGSPHISRCDDLVVVSGNEALVPATIKLEAQASDNLGDIKKYTFYFGDGHTTETTSNTVEHRYEVSGTFISRVKIQDSVGNWRTSSACTTVVRIKSSPIETHKADCSNVYITDGEGERAPTTGKFTVTGYDNKGDIQKYKLDFGNGIIKESEGSTFEQNYDIAGTYTIKGYIQDSQGNWHGGENGCEETLHVSTEPITTQPNTGTSTIFSLLSISSGAAGLVLKKKRYFS